MKPVRQVYLDTNIYCRPLDDQKDRRINAETQALLKIVDANEKGEIAIISSEYVKFEIEKVKYPLKRKNIRGFEKILSKANVTSSKRLITLAKEINAKCNLNSLDALHLAAACTGKANFFLTCDDEILNDRNCIETLVANKGYELKVRNPINYIREHEEE
ncbi:MAG: PIN domain-containing protein [Candidatus Bathyarchaeia archaeon]|jgi:predicted nucleic acid-binding protein